MPAIPFIPILTGLMLLAWPFLIGFGLANNNLHGILPVIALVLLLRVWQVRRQSGPLRNMILGVALTGVALCAASYVLHAHQWVLFYPVVVNLVMLVVFGGSLWTTMPMVERFARLREPTLSPTGIRYTRIVTRVWCGFFIGNGAMALFTVLHADIRLWTLWNGIIAYILMGTLMACEWLVRQRVMKNDVYTLNNSSCMKAATQRIPRSVHKYVTGVSEESQRTGNLKYDGYKPLPLSQWLSAPRPDDTPIAWRDDGVWTLGDLRHDVTQLVNTLRQEEGERWALCVENGYLFTVALLATLHAGKTPVLPGHSRAAQLNEQRDLFSGVLSDAALAFSGRQRLVASTPRTDNGFSPLPAIDDTRAIELFTSGSTGAPQRVVKPIISLDREARLLAEQFGDRLAGCHVVASVVLHHLYGLTFRVVLPMALGLPSRTNLLNYAEQLSALPHDKRYLFISSPAFLKRLDTALTPPPVALLISAGGVLPWRDITAFQGWLDLWPDEIYGSTETGVMAWRHRQDETTRWQPFPGVTFHDGRVTSPLIHEPEGVVLDDNLHFAADGQFSIVGRRGRVVKIEDKRVSLDEIEQRLLALDGICDAAALAVTRGGRQGIGVLLVLSDDARMHRESVGKNAQESAWRRALRPCLEPVAVPRYWRIVDEIPVNSMNKRVTAQLQELFHEDP